MRLLLLVLTAFVSSCTAVGLASDDVGADADPDSIVDRTRDVQADQPTRDVSGTDAIDEDTLPDVDPPDLGPVIETIRIDPPAFELRTTYGEPAAANVRAYATLSDGLEIDVTGTADWRTDSPTMLRIAADGTASTGGIRGGTLNYYARQNDVEAVGTATIRVSALSTDEDIPIEEVAAFEGADPLGTTPPNWLYPEAGTVYPAGLAAPFLQWDNAGNGLVHLALEVGDYARVDHYTRGASYEFSEEMWRFVADDFEEPIRMTLTGATSAGEPTSVGETRELITADANLEGSVYYWQIRTGDIMEIPYDEPAARPLFPDNAETGSCRGCHAITRDGGRIGFMYNGGGDPRAGLAWVDEPDPPIVPNASEFQWDFLSFDPSGHRAAAVINGDMWLADTTPGLPTGIANLGPIAGVNDDGRRATTPAWSPDGSLLAFIERQPGGVDWSYETGDIWTIPWDETSGTFGAPTELLTPSGEGIDTLSYPTWSPDSRLLAYSAGPNNRGDPPAEIHMMDPLSMATVRLTNGGPEGLDVMPAFSPFREGGYYWLLFYSRRPYGVVSTNKQLWVMAVDADYAFDGSDPSHAAFWLPGQSPSEANITAYWARSGCEREGNQCKTDQDCCAGLQCIRDPELGEICTRVDCTLPGRACSDELPCCGGFECASSLIGTNVCQESFAP